MAIVSDLDDKDALLAPKPVTFSTTSHFDGHPSAIVNLGAVDEEELTELLTDAWRCRAPRTLLRALEDR